MARAIEYELAAIRNARLGEEVRGAIHDSIERCYDDVQNGVTIAEGVATRANAVVSDAETTVAQAMRVANNASATLNERISDFDTEVQQKISSYDTTINGKVADINAALGTMSQQTTIVENATTRANAAAANLEELTVTCENVGPNEQGSIVFRTINGHRDMYIKLRQGARGESNVVKGDAFATLAYLEAGVPNPAIGDMYNVGTEPPYTIYRWTGTTWENQGQIGMNVVSIESSEIDDLWAGNEVTGSNVKYLDRGGLTNLIGKVLSALSGKVNTVMNKGLSTNDYSDADKAQVDKIGSGSFPTSANTIIAALNDLKTLIDGKVTAVSGKTLSTNDYTATDKAKVNKIGTATLTTTAQTLCEAVNELKANHFTVENQQFTPSWVSSGDATYAYYTDVSVSGIDSNWYADVVFNPAEATSGNFGPACTTLTNAVRIYCKTNTYTSLTIATIALWR